MLALNEFIDHLYENRGESFVFTTMGSAREWSKRETGARDFMYIPSSMGQLPNIAFGFALTRQSERVIAVNGDGCMLMNLGSLVTISALSPKNFVLCVVNNGEYEVTGHQPTVANPKRRITAEISYAEIARGAGWNSTRVVSNMAELQAANDILFELDGPHFIELKVEPMQGDVSPKSPGPAADRALQFRKAAMA